LNRGWASAEGKRYIKVNRGWASAEGKRYIKVKTLVDRPLDEGKRGTLVDAWREPDQLHMLLLCIEARGAWKLQKSGARKIQKGELGGFRKGS